MHKIWTTQRMETSAQQLQCMYHLKNKDTPETTVWELTSKWNTSGMKNREGKEKGNKFIERCVEKKKTFGYEIL